MNRLPDDATARREWLEQWAAAQRVLDEHHLPAPLPLRIRLREARRELASWSDSVASRLLDRGLNTAGRATEPEHEHPDRNLYLPSPWYVLPRALRYLGVSDRDTFVDFGCGKGRVVHQAAKWPFRRVIGVEISPVLAEIARNALAARRHQHRSRNVEIVVSDVADFPVPDDLTIAYLFHPFLNETLETLLRGLVESIDRHPRRVRLIYVCPELAPQVLATDRFRILKEQRNRLLDTHLSRATIFESVSAGAEL